MLAIFVVVASIVFADETELFNRLDAVNEKLQESLPDQERANLLFEKSQLMFNLFGQLYLRTATESLLKAIELDPDTKESREFLAEVYDLYWANRDFNGEDRISKDLAELKKRCKKLLKR
jgi:hypothetical protein